MKLRDKVIYQQPAGPKNPEKGPAVEATIAAIVPIGVDPAQHPEKCQTISEWKDLRSFLGGAPRDHVSYIIATPQGLHKDGTPKPFGLEWPKVAHIEPVKVAKPKEIKRFKE